MEISKQILESIIIFLYLNGEYTACSELLWATQRLFPPKEPTYVKPVEN
jgi:hypothetical protein